MKKYWHRIPDKELQKRISRKWSCDRIMRRYSQPEWCNYPEALSGLMGCWSLIDVKRRKKINREFCRNCEYFSVGT